MGRLRIAIPVAIFGFCSLLSATLIMGGGVGISGPDQVIQIEQGETASSYMRVWNEGATDRGFVLGVEGDCSPLIDASPSGFSLGPEEQQLVDLAYTAPMDQAPGTYTGSITVSIEGDIAGSVTRQVTVTVQARENPQLSLRSGTNLVGWIGTDATFGDALGMGEGATKVWTRSADGSYTSAQYYPSAGIWWSKDDSFTELEYGHAYFIECEAECSIDYVPGSGSGQLVLEDGTNLIVWIGEDRSLEQAFPQSPEEYSVTKVWRRTEDGEYEFAQYYPSAGSWWSKDPTFNQLEEGEAYFVESDSQVQVSV